jgi:diguanylate cyclase (GGDEF)-like protein
VTSYSGHIHCENAEHGVRFGSFHDPFSMSATSSTRDLWALLLPIAVGLALLVLAPRLAWGAAPQPAFALGFLVLLLLAGGAGAFHRPFGATTLGLGAVLLAPAFERFGLGPALGLAAAALLAADFAWRNVRSGGVVPLPERRRLWRSVAGAGRAVAAAFAAGALWLGLPRWRPTLPLAVVAALAFIGFALVWFAFEVAEAKIRRPEARVRWSLATPLVTDLVGFATGVGVAEVGRQAGWGLASVVALLFTILAAECGRSGILFEKMRRRARDLERLRRAGRRIVTAAQEMAGVVLRIHAECKVVKFHWFQFEALTPGSEFKSWWSGPGSDEIFDGIPTPDLFPPTLPGFHRRSNWQVIERVLRVEGGKVIARIRLWCDPRVLDPHAVELLDGLLPQMAVSVERCLLDREAREDPLTGVAVRRFLEPRLHELHAQAIEEGLALSVILCDVDHFKRINDNFGHPVGDKALIAVAQVLKDERRDTDLLCRYGGEEFVLVLEKTTGGTAMAIAERIRRQIAALDLESEGQKIPLNMSFGVAAFPELYIKTAAELILFADEALYEAKRRGRNRCLLDLGQGRYMDVLGDVHVSEDAPAATAVAAPRIFA